MWNALIVHFFAATIPSSDKAGRDSAYRKMILEEPKSDAKERLGGRPDPLRGTSDGRIERRYRWVHQEAKDEDIRVAYLLDPLFNYIERRWIANINRRKWMTFFKSMERTNNCCESHNRVLRAAVGAHRPNVFAFMMACARIEHNTYLDIDLMQNHHQCAKRRRRWQSLYADRNLKGISNDLEMDIFHDRNTTIRNFVHQAAGLLNNAFNDHVRLAGRAG